MNNHQDPILIERRLKQALADDNAKALHDLIAGGIDVNTVLDDGKGAFSLLSRACILGCHDCVKTLLDHGADIHYKNAFGYDALYFAVNSHWLAIAESLITAGATINNTYFQPDGGVNNLLIQALWHNPFSKDDSVAELLIRHGIDVNYKNRDGNTALIIAAQYRKNKIINILLDHNADIMIENISGRTAFDYSKGDFLEKIIACRNEAEQLAGLIDTRSESKTDPLSF